MTARFVIGLLLLGFVAGFVVEWRERSRMVWAPRALASVAVGCAGVGIASGLILLISAAIYVITGVNIFGP